MFTWLSWRCFFTCYHGKSPSNYRFGKILFAFVQASNSHAKSSRIDTLTPDTSLLYRLFFEWILGCHTSIPLDSWCEIPCYVALLILHLHSDKTSRAGWNMGPDWRCISYSECGYSIAMLVYRRVRCSISVSFFFETPRNSRRLNLDFQSPCFSLNFL